MTHDPWLHWLHKGAVAGVIARRVKATLLKSSNWTSSGRTPHACPEIGPPRSTHGRHALPENGEDREGREEEKEQLHDGVTDHQEAWIFTLD